MMDTTGARAWQPRSIEGLLADPHSRGVLIAASRNPDAKITFILTPPAAYSPGRGSSRLAVKIPTTDAAGQAVEHEGRMLVELKRLPLGGVGHTVPRYVESMRIGARQVLVSTAMAGTPMSVPYHQWLHTARRRLVRRDFALAADWLRDFQRATAHPAEPTTWATEVADALRGRWDGHPRLDAALSNLQVAERNLTPCKVTPTAVHGDVWCGNLLVLDGRLSGVVDWEGGTCKGSPLRDIARFALSYCLYLDRHTRPGYVVVGHPGLRRVGVAPGVHYGLLSHGWFPDLVRAFIAGGLDRLGMSRGHWYDVALAGVGEVAASANDDDFAATHLELLAALPAHPRRHRT